MLEKLTTRCEFYDCCEFYDFLDCVGESVGKAVGDPLGKRVRFPVRGHMSWCLAQVGT